MKNNFFSSKSFWITAGIAVMVLSMAMRTQKAKQDNVEMNTETSVSTVLTLLGEPNPMHAIAEEKKQNKALIAKGRELVFEGRTTDETGKKSKRISNFFNCTHCHNTVIEDPDLRVSDPEARLDYVINQNKPLLPATTFYGIVSRTSFYNDDYAKKYGKLVEPARHNLIQAMQLCATECAQGRTLEQWEIDALLAYYYSIDLKLKDLSLSQSELKQLNTAFATDDMAAKQEAIKLVRSKFFNASPATFVTHSDKSIRKYGEAGNAENGKKIYVHSCMNCHKPVGGVTNFKLDMEKVTFRFLKRNFKKNNHFSVYFMVRKGTYAVPGYRPYMPNFSKERMSNKQMEDLVAFINQQAK